jgi:hypothetical protein
MVVFISRQSLFSNLPCLFPCTRETAAFDLPSCPSSFRTTAPNGGTIAAIGFTGICHFGLFVNQ